MSYQGGTEYQSSRVSIIIVSIIFVLELTLLFFGLQRDNLTLAVTSVVISSVVFLLFFSLSVQVSRDGVVLSFGIGVVKRVVALEDIQRMEVVPNHSLSALYEPGREHVLRLYLRSGGAVQVAVGDARQMMNIISNLNRR